MELTDDIDIEGIPDGEEEEMARKKRVFMSFWKKTLWSPNFQ